MNPVKPATTILSLNDYLLIIIFEYCSNEDVDNISYTCKRFQEITENYIVYKKTLDLPLVTHRPYSRTNKLTINKFTYGERLKIYLNLSLGRYQEEVFFNHKLMCPAFIHLERNRLYITNRGALRSYKRLPNQDLLSRRPATSVGHIKDADITCLMKKDDIIFAGRENGFALVDCENDCQDIRLYSSENNRSQYINSVDFVDEIFISASMKSLNVWRKCIEIGTITLDEIAQYDNYYKCLKIAPEKRKFAAGKYIDRNSMALQLFDIETNTNKILNSPTTSIYSLLWKDDETLLTANYDTTLRLFDCRTNHDEHIWEDPFDSSIYTLDYDGVYGVVCGMKMHSRVNLYDLRVPKRCIQMYYPLTRMFNGGSPVYSLATDSSQLFIVTDHNLRILNFKADAKTTETRDYANYFQK